MNVGAGMPSWSTKPANPSTPLVIFCQPCVNITTPTITRARVGPASRTPRSHGYERLFMLALSVDLVPGCRIRFDRWWCCDRLGRSADLDQAFRPIGPSRQKVQGDDKREILS